jgi:hypothetical protein
VGPGLGRQGGGGGYQGASERGGWVGEWVTGAHQLRRLHSGISSANLEEHQEVCGAAELDTSSLCLVLACRAAEMEQRHTGTVTQLAGLQEQLREMEAFAGRQPEEPDEVMAQLESAIHSYQVCVCVCVWRGGGG